MAEGGATPRTAFSLKGNMTVNIVCNVKMGRGGWSTPGARDLDQRHAPRELVARRLSFIAVACAQTSRTAARLASVKLSYVSPPASNLPAAKLPRATSLLPFVTVCSFSIYGGGISASPPRAHVIAGLIFASCVAVTSEPGSTRHAFHSV